MAMIVARSPPYVGGSGGCGGVASRGSNQSLKRDGTSLAWFSRSGRSMNLGAGDRYLDLPVPPLILVLGGMMGYGK